MVGTSTSTYHCEQSLPNQDVCSTYRTCSGRARCGKIDRSIAQPTECFSWRGYSHRGLSRKALGDLLQYDNESRRSSFRPINVSVSSTGCPNFAFYSFLTSL